MCKYQCVGTLGAPAPEYSIVGEDITIKFTANNSIFNDVDDTVNGTVNGAVNGTVNGTVNLSETERHILEAISNEPTITKVQLSKELGIGSTTIARTTKKLKELGVIKRVGSAKTGHWEICQTDIPNN